MKPRSPTPPRQPSSRRPSASARPPLPRRGWRQDLLLLGLLLIIPAGGLQQWCQRTGVPYWVVLAPAAGLSLLTWWAYRRDKRAAQANEPRTPETTLHLLELLGGWPGAFLAQRRLRHKNVKKLYQLCFWLIVALHQIYLGWLLSHYWGP